MQAAACTRTRGLAVLFFSRYVGATAALFISEVFTAYTDVVDQIHLHAAQVFDYLIITFICVAPCSHPRTCYCITQKGISKK